MAPKLYYMPASPPCQVVMLVARALKLDLDLKLLSMREKKEHLTPDFLKMNPQHTVPTLDDDGHYVYESRAIIGYLANQYAKEDSIYPQDPKKRARVNQMLFFEMELLAERASSYARPVVFSNEAPDPEKFKKIKEALSILNTLLEGNTWVTGDKLTIADYTMLVSVSYVTVIPGIDLNKQPNVLRWLNNAKTAIEGYEEIVIPHIENRAKLFKDKFSKYLQGLPL